MTPRIIKEIITEEFSNCPEKRTQEVSYFVIKKFADRWNIIMKDENDEEKNSSHDDLPSKYTASGVWRNPKRYRDSAKVAREKFPNIEQQMDDLIKDFISNPSCEGERRINAWIEKQISHLRAIKYLQR